MSPVNTAVGELRLAVQTAEQRAREAAVEAKRLQAEGAPKWRFDDVVSDLQAAIHGDLSDALDRIDPKLGTRLFQALCGDVDMAEELR